MKYLFLLLISANLQAASLPAAWYDLSDDQTINVATPDTSSLSQELDAIFATQSKVLAEQKSGDLPWRFVAFICDLAVSAKGQLGQYTWKGTPGISVYWMKKVAKVATEENKSGPALELTNQTTQSQFDQEMELAIQAILASNKVDNEALLRQNFKNAAQAFIALADAVDRAAPESEWQPSRIRADLSVEISGKVGFAPSAGAAVRARLEWFKVSKQTSQLAKPLSFSGKGLPELLTALSQDLQSLSDSSQTPKFIAKTFRVGLGVSVSGNVSLAKGTAKTVAHLYFSKVAKSPGILAINDDLPLNLMDAPAGEDMLYQLDRKKFRAGLKKAIGIGEFFAGIAARNENASWKVKQLKTNLEVAISGKVGLSTVSGIATAEIAFENKNF